MEDPQRDDVLATIDAMIGELLQRAGVAEPPVDAIALAQKTLGMVVVLDKRQSLRGRSQGKQQIFLRPEPREERHQWTVAVEIGRHFKADLLARLGVEPGATGSLGGEASLFATRLLAPTAWFAADAASAEYDLLALKQRYKTASHEMLAWRLLDLSAPCIITIIDNDAIHRRRSNAWPARKELSPPEKKCQKRVHESGQPREVREAGWSVRGWPVHQDDWKREILRAVRDDESH